MDYAIDFSELPLRPQVTKETRAAYMKKLPNGETLISGKYVESILGELPTGVFGPDWRDRSFIASQLNAMIESCRVLPYASLLREIPPVDVTVAQFGADVPFEMCDHPECPLDHERISFHVPVYRFSWKTTPAFSTQDLSALMNYLECDYPEYGRLFHHEAFNNPLWRAAIEA